MKYIKKFGEFEVYQRGKNDFLVKNKNGRYEHHSHVSSRDAAIVVANVAHRQTIPKTKSPYLVTSIIRVVTDEEHINRLQEYKNSLLEKK